MITERSQVEFITTELGFTRLIASIRASQKIHSLDLETTGLDPLASHVRTLNIAGPCCPKPVVIDLFEAGLDFRSIATYVAKAARWYVFNVLFEGRWFDEWSDVEATLYDVGLMSKARLGGRPLSLKQMIQRDLNIEIDKDEQLSDWTIPKLTDKQIIYAAGDGQYTYELGEYWLKELEEHNCVEGFFVFNDAWRGTAAMEDRGMLIDEEYHKKLIHMWTLRRDTAERVLRKYTPPDMLPNLRSKPQLSKLLSQTFDAPTVAAWPKTGAREQLNLERKYLKQVSFRSPYPMSRWLAALMVFNRADKYLGTYGEKLINIQRMAGRIRARFNIAQAVTGRYSSSEPNLQNIPRSILVRRSFIAGVGWVLILADYSGIELRVLGELSQDTQLLHDVIFGDVHAENAILINGFDRERFFAALKAKDPRAKEKRAVAKAFSFQLTYGAGFGALAVVLRCSDDDAKRHVDKWAARYPQAFNYRFTMAETMNMDGFLPVNGERTIYVRRPDRSIPVASNYPVQGAAANVMYRAITRTHKWYEHEAPSFIHGGLLASVHDELLSITLDNEDHAKLCLEAQKECMTQAWLDTFPGSATDNLLESAIGYSWAAKP